MGEDEDIVAFSLGNGLPTVRGPAAVRFLRIFGNFGKIVGLEIYPQIHDLQPSDQKCLTNSALEGERLFQKNSMVNVPVAQTLLSSICSYLQSSTPLTDRPTGKSEAQRFPWASHPGSRFPHERARPILKFHCRLNPARVIFSSSLK